MSCAECCQCTCQKNSAVEVISASSAKSLRQEAPEQVARIERFNDRLKSAMKARESELHLLFSDFGYDWADVQFISDAGYVIHRNGPCLWWEVDLSNL